MEAKFEANPQRPYFEGIERDDVVKHRNEFVNYFLAPKNSYYMITDDDQTTWNMPPRGPHRILICKRSNQDFSNIIYIMLLLMFIFSSLW